MKNEEKPASIYTIRKNGRIYAQSEIHNCGYSSQIIRMMARAGYFLYKDGKRVKIGGGANG